MQNPTAPPRDALSAAQVASLLAGGPQVSVSQGCDLLDTSNNVVADISTDMVAGGEITGDNTVTGESIAGKCQLKLQRELAWGRDRVRPWVSLTANLATVTSTTIIDRPAVSASRTDNTDAGLAQGTLTNTVASGGLKLTSTTSPTYAQAVLADSPTAYWRFQETSGTTAADFAHSFTGTHSGAVVLAQPGPLNDGTASKSVQYSATGAQTAVPAGAIANRSAVTVEFWIKRTNNSAGSAFTWYDAGGNRVVNGHMPWNDNIVYFDSTGPTGGSSGFDEISKAVDYTITDWHHFALVKDTASGMKIYRDGVLWASLSTKTAQLNAAVSGVIGSGLAGVELGWLAEFAVYPVALSASRIAAHYAAASPGATTYATAGTRVAPPLGLSTLAAVDSSSVSWTATTPTGTAVTVETSVNGGSTWQAATNGGPIAGVAASGSVLTRATLTGNGSATPTLSTLAVSATQNQISHVVTSKSFGPVTAKWYQGVYVLTTPQQPSGETPVTYDVQGYDLTSILTDQVGDTYIVPAGTTYLTALRNVLTASGVGANLLLAGDAGSTTLPYTMVWALYDGGPSWLSICADLLDVIGYNRLWADEVGNLRSEPKVATASAPVAWTFDATDAVAGIVAPGWTRDEDTWAAPNKWTFIQSNTNGVSPTVANGLVYKVTNQSDGPSSIDSLSGRVRPKTVYLDVPDAVTLKARGDAAVAADKAAGTKVTMRTFLPAASQGDVVQFVSSHRSEKLPVQTWTTNLDGSPGTWELGAWPVDSAAPLSAPGAGTVTQASPLRIVMDGANQDSPANSLDGTAYAIGARVTVTVRNPIPPLVQGVESATS